MSCFNHFFSGNLYRFRLAPRAIPTLVLFAFFNCGPLAVSQTSAVGYGTISGVVLDGGGQPVAGATVRIVDTPVRATDLDQAATSTTDQEGKFVIRPVSWGAYTIQAMKPQDGYADPFVLFYRPPGAQPTVTISELQPNVDVIVPIGPRAGIIQISVKDAVTGKTVDAAEATLRRWRAPVYSVSVPANGPVFVPSGIGVVLEVHAGGYEVWRHFDSDNGDHPGPLEMKPGEQRKLEVRLRPLTGR